MPILLKFQRFLILAAHQAVCVVQGYLALPHRLPQLSRQVR